MASVPIGGQLYSRYLSKQMKTQAPQNEGGSAKPSRSELSDSRSKTSYLFSTSASPRARFMNLFDVSHCSSEKNTLDRDFNVKGPQYVSCEESKKRKTGCGSIKNLYNHIYM